MLQNRGYFETQLATMGMGTARSDVKIKIKKIGLWEVRFLVDSNYTFMSFGREMIQSF